MYVCIPLAQRRVKTLHMTGYRTSEHDETMHIDGSSSVCSAKCTNVAYISASVNIVKISVLIVSRQSHSSWNRLCAVMLNVLDVFKLCYSSE